jgi:hypothetical protein
MHRKWRRFEAKWALHPTILGRSRSHTATSFQHFKYGIKVEGENKRLTIIQNASKVPRLDSAQNKGEDPRI